MEREAQPAYVCRDHHRSSPATPVAGDIETADSAGGRASGHAQAHARDQREGRSI